MFLKQKSFLYSRALNGHYRSIMFMSIFLKFVSKMRKVKKNNNNEMKFLLNIIYREGYKVLDRTLRMFNENYLHLHVMCVCTNAWQAYSRSRIYRRGGPGITERATPP